MHSGNEREIRSPKTGGDVRDASALQRSMLPDSPAAISGYEIDAHLVGCPTVGGDLYQCLLRPTGQQLLVLGEAAGQGMTAANCMAAASSLLMELAQTPLELGALTETVHSRLFKNLAEDQFLTMFLAEIEPDSSRFVYASAGQVPMRWIHSDGSVDELSSTGLPIALIEKSTVGVKELQLAPDDLIAMASEGIARARSYDWRFFDEQSLDEILRAFRHEPLRDIRDRVFGAVVDFLGREGAMDDLTLLLLRRTA